MSKIVKGIEASPGIMESVLDPILITAGIFLIFLWIKPMKRLLFVSGFLYSSSVRLSIQSASSSRLVPAAKRRPSSQVPLFPA